MGLKHVETIKSVVLILLIALSITLTFSIWTYTPNYEMIEQPSTSDILIAEKRDIGSVVKPYKLLFHFEEDLKGTVDTEEIDHIIRTIREWTISDLTLEDPKFTEDKLDAFLREKNRFTLFFNGEVPFPVYDSVLTIEDSNIPEDSFDRIIVDWQPDNPPMKMYFISKRNNLRYSAEVRRLDAQIFESQVLAEGRSYETYAEVNPGGAPFIVVPTKSIELKQYTYYLNETSEINLTKFRDALFNDPSKVRSGPVGTNSEELRDDYARMRVDTKMKKMNYVYPGAKSEEPMIPSDLLLKTFDFVNKHGGWTDDFRFTYLNSEKRAVKFQLHVDGLPVYSDPKSASTEIEQVWGNEQVFHYIRPYYTLDSILPPEVETKTLPSGLEVAEMLLESEDTSFNMIDEITLGYYLNYDADHKIFVLEPSWYYGQVDSWIRFSPEDFGGEKIGLE